MGQSSIWYSRRLTAPVYRLRPIALCSAFTDIAISLPTPRQDSVSSKTSSWHHQTCNALFQPHITGIQQLSLRLVHGCLHDG
ncbi:hypothetical protein HYDPIDRAFT_107903, partial [Hydnomerulius pinastri MD-312]